MTFAVFGFISVLSIWAVYCSNHTHCPDQMFQSRNVTNAPMHQHCRVHCSPQAPAQGLVNTGKLHRRTNAPLLPCLMSGCFYGHRGKYSRPRRSIIRIREAPTQRAASRNAAHSLRSNSTDSGGRRQAQCRLSCSSRAYTLAGH